ncbi:MAG: hypothetical protein JW811_05845 [Clostridiales bacterium]|nr:hypothetical protein [Clostridiales bacterium]
MSRSERKGSRRLLPLLSLAFVLLLAAAFVFLLPLIKETFPPDDSAAYVYTPSYRTLAGFDESALDIITVTHAGGESYTLVYQDGILSLMTDTGSLEPISAAISDSFIKYATTIYVEDTLARDESEVADQLSAMGLAPPQIKATAVFTDGSEITVRLGDSLFDTTYHYYQWSGDDGVYLCNAGVYETFAYTADMLRTVVQPPISASLVERVSIRHGDGEPIVCGFETDGTGTLESPFIYPMDAEAVQALITAISNFRLGARLLPLTDETLALYGLDAPQAVIRIDQREGLYSDVTSGGAFISYTMEPSAITLTLGDADGEFFRFCGYEGTCYRVSSFLVSAFIKADAKNYAALNPADMGDVTILGITVRTGNGALELRASYTENVLPNNELETDEDGNIVYTAEVSCNGEPIAAAAFDALADRLKQLIVSGRLDGAAAPDGTPRWQLILTTAQGKTRTLAAYPMDSFQDILTVDGVALHYISNEALDIALGEFAALLKQTDIS